MKNTAVKQNCKHTQDLNKGAHFKQLMQLMLWKNSDSQKDHPNNGELKQSFCIKVPLNNPRTLTIY